MKVDGNICTDMSGFTYKNYKIPRKSNPSDITLANYEFKLVTNGHKDIATVKRELENPYLGRMNIMEL